MGGGKGGAKGAGELVKGGGQVGGAGGVRWRTRPPALPAAVVERAELLPPRGAAPKADGSPLQPRVVAVKRLKPEVLEVEEDVVSFVNEARLLLKLRNK